MQFTEWNGKDLTGQYQISYKIDGVQARNVNNTIVSKNGNPLYNVDRGKKAFEIAEIYCGNWNDTMSIVRASKSKRRQVKPGEIYTLVPNIDRRLLLGTVRNPSAFVIKSIMKRALARKYEGLVLRNIDTNDYIKVKPVQTIDVKIINIVPSTSKSFNGMLKEFETEKGFVGTGFTHAQRKEYMDKSLIGKYIEVKCMEFTKDGFFRHPRFVRLRLDK